MFEKIFPIIVIWATYLILKSISYIFGMGFSTTAVLVGASIGCIIGGIIVHNK